MEVIVWSKNQFEVTPWYHNEAECCARANLRRLLTFKLYYAVAGHLSAKVALNVADLVLYVKKRLLTLHFFTCRFGSALCRRHFGEIPKGRCTVCRGDARSWWTCVFCVGKCAFRTSCYLLFTRESYGVQVSTSVLLVFSKQMVCGW